MRTLTPAERRVLRAKAHRLHPFVSIGQHGLAPAVLREIDVALRAHELIKIRVFCDDRGERESLYVRICDELDAAPVQHIGKLLIVWRPAPAAEPAAGGGAPGRRAPSGKRERGRQPGPKPAPTGGKRRAAEVRLAAVPTRRRRKSAANGGATGNGTRQTRRRRSP